MRRATMTFGLFLVVSVAAGADSESRMGAKLDKLSEALVEQLDLPKGQGLLLSKVKPDSPAAKAGLKPYDVLLELGGKSVPNNLADLNKMMDDIKPDSTVSALVLRKGKKELVKELTLPEGKKEEKKAGGLRPIPNAGGKTAENLKKALEGLGQGVFPGAEPDDIRKMLEQLQGAGKKGPDPEMLRKMLEKFGGGAGGEGVDPEQLRKMLDKFGGGGGGKGVDAEKLQKMLEKIGGGAGGQGLDPEQLRKMLDKFGGGGAKGFDAEKLRELLKKKSGATPKDEEKKAPAEPKKLIDIRFFAPVAAVELRFSVFENGGVRVSAVEECVDFARLTPLRTQ